MALRLNGIADYLQNQRQQPSPLDAAMMSRTLGKYGTPQVKSGSYYGDAGMYGGPATLPSNPGPIDPPILTQGGYSNIPNTPSYSLGPTWSGIPLPSNVGSDAIRPVGGGSGGPSDSYQSPANSGPYSGSGTNGPQGSVYSTDPNTNNPIYNVTGSPSPGFFDSKTGKFVEGLGSTALNMFVPGAGSAARAIFDAIRRHQTGSNTGTDLSGNTGPGGGIAGGAGGQSGPAWFQPGYQPPSGIQEAIARGDYTNAYGSTPSSITANRIMSSQAYGGQPNNVRGTTDEGHNNFNLGNNAMLGHMNDGTLEHVASTFDPSGLSRAPQAGLNAELLARLSGRYSQPIYVPPRPTAPPMMIQSARGG